MQTNHIKTFLWKHLVEPSNAVHSYVYLASICMVSENFFIKIFIDIHEKISKEQKIVLLQKSKLQYQSITSGLLLVSSHHLTYEEYPKYLSHEAHC